MVGAFASQPRPHRPATTGWSSSSGPWAPRPRTTAATRGILAAQARSYGASVSEIYSPSATWSRVAAAARGAKVLIYLGHGNGWPSPYPPYSTDSKDGMGLNASAGHGNLNVKYYGEAWVRKLGPGAATPWCC